MFNIIYFPSLPKPDLFLIYIQINQRIVGIQPRMGAQSLPNIPNQKGLVMTQSVPSAPSLIPCLVKQLFSLTCIQWLSAFLLVPSTLFATSLQPDTLVEFKGDIFGKKDISAIGKIGELLIIGADEGNQIQVLRPTKKGVKYKVWTTIDLPINEQQGDEVDTEAIAVEGNQIYVTGSHSISRKKVGKKFSYEKNLKRIATTQEDANRKWIYSFTLNPETGKPKSKIAQASLTKIIKQDPILSRFSKIPSKENGIDIEGLALKKNQLYFGFRGPVLRGNFVPVIRAKYTELSTPVYQKLFLNLNGNGVRDLVAIEEGFLVLSGPMGDGNTPYQLYLWNGQDMLPGVKNTDKHLKYLGSFKTPNGAKPEGITVLSRNKNSLQIILVSDSVKNGGAAIYKIAL